MENSTNTQQSQQQKFTSAITAHAIRLLPGDNLYTSIEQYIKDNNISAGFIMTCVGSLKEIHIRLANSTNFLVKKECYEITSLVGCISCNDRMHLHISLGDHEGKAYGGHLTKEGNIVYTTAEIIIGELPGLSFSKEYCPLSQWDELKISSSSTNTNADS